MAGFCTMLLAALRVGSSTDVARKACSTITT